MSRAELEWACTRGELKKVKALLDQGADVAGMDGELWDKSYAGIVGNPRFVPLCVAARGGYDEVVLVLLDNGADIEQQDYQGNTALEHAAESGQLETVKLLLAKGASLHNVNVDGKSILAELLSRSELDLAVLRLLAERGAVASDDLLDRFAWVLRSRSQDYASYRKAVIQRFGVLREYWTGETKRIDALLKRVDAKFKLKLERQKQRAKKLRALLEPKALKGNIWFTSVKRLLGKSVVGRFEQLAEVCDEVLAHPRAVAHPKWPELVRHLTELTISYGDITEEAYGKRLALDCLQDDEGGVMEDYADQRLSTIELALKVLASSPALEHSAWLELAVHVCRTKRERLGYLSFGDDEVGVLVERAQEHPRCKELLLEARAAFPFASLGTRGGPRRR